ncbi:1-acyl-sn-glycerol-3-phosphate acyltransferase [Pseudenhygromyxa sp. WMMC2535]|uniref:lysophospholipid acyltransferase family protein n=1 Tax=Pseudenhygromyxa sp. WMMC2535 TaxID=2712867 RepID=UPI001552AA2D|nr:lysophospholipid acyltransferase family protein [Pseudenhygromyxa sp. WMMC2535]NVB37338.1 1-acyl-sn-glycerol-3-phosphate acyltransferase [Pseudenhygromyxa sp. WMMC2535]
MNAPVESGLDAALEVGPAGLLPRLAAGPAAALRSSRRFGRTSMFLVDFAHHVRRELRALPDDAASTLRRQGSMAFAAENLCVLSGFATNARGPLPEGPAILMCNHVSWQDPLLVANVVPAIPVAKREVGEWPMVGDLARGLDVLLVDRASAHSGARVLLRARELLARGASILTFPEGTTTTGEDILPLRRGMFGVAAQMDVPVIPIALRYRHADASWVGDANFLPHYLETVARPQTIAELSFGAPLHAEAGEAPEAFAERTRAVMRALLRQR